MSERDAFGRGRDDDTLAGMGWREPTFTATIEGATATPAPAPPTAELPFASRPTAAPGPAPPLSAPAPARRGRRRRGHGPRVMTRVLFLGIVAASVLFALRSGTGVVGDIEDTIRGRAGGVTRTVPVEGGSLLQARAFGAALKGLPTGDVEMLRLAPGELDAQVIVQGRRHSVRVSASGRVLDVPTPGGSRVKPVRVDARAPARFVRTAARRAGRPRGTVSYLVLMRLGGRPQWQLFFKDGLHYSANAGGRNVRRVGG